MKRHPDLIRYSREHHGALVLANRVKRATSDEALAALMPSGEFLQELEQHFADEELAWGQSIDRLPALAQRFHEDHTRLRELITRLAAGQQVALTDFARHLEAHVRFEERELFPALEQLVS